MSKHPLPNDDLNLFETFDLRAFVSTLRLRWWIVPTVLVLSVGLLVAQQSRMKVEPPFVRVSKSYEVPSPLLLLGPVGINPALVTEFPDAQGQLAKLRSSQIQAEISYDVGSDIQVQVPSNYNSPFVLSCESEIQELCEQAIEKYAEKASEIRRGALEYTLSTLRDVYEAAYESTRDPIALSKVSAIDALLSNLNTNLVLTGSEAQSIGASIEAVNRTEVIFALIAGLLISLLIILQLTFRNSRLHTERQLVEIVGRDSFLGTASDGRQNAETRRAAVALFQKLALTDSARIAYLPIRKPFSSTSRLENIAEMAGVPITILKPFSEMEVPEIVRSAPGEGVVVVVVRNQDLRRDLIDVAVGMSNSGRTILGFLLLDH
jgi:hypothetical protein